MSEKNRLSFWLKRTRYFLDLAGSPDKGMKIIHVTGTAGKGSVSNLLHNILMADGKKVGSFTSPFVSSTIEKIRVNDLYIDADRFAQIIERFIPLIDHAYTHSPYGQPSFFEIFFAIALTYFKEEKCDWVVLEVGLGGRHDATNVIRNPKATVITGIDYDHMSIIGKTLNKIAYEKAGIIKSGSTFFTGEHRPKLQKMFKEICVEKGVPYVQVKYGTNFEENNKRLAATITRSIGVTEDAIQKGINGPKLPARFEVMQSEPLVVIDGAHNPIKMKSTAYNLKKLNYNRLHLVIGIAEGKDYSEILKEIIPLADSIQFTRFQGGKDRKCAHPNDLLAISQKYLKKGVKSEIFLHPKMALDKALALANEKDGAKDLVLVTGSFFLAGELRKHWISEEKILTNRRMK